MTDWLILDIETVYDEELPPNLEPEKFPSPPHHKVTCIGALLINSDYDVKKIGLISGLGEAEILTAFTKYCIDYKPCLVSFNGRGFDLPVIASRCFRHGITFRYYYKSRDVRYRYSIEDSFDLMDYLADFGATKVSKLGTIAKLCGMPGKLDVSGKDTAAMSLADTQLYCLSDVVQTTAIFLRVQLLRGELEKEKYIEKAQNFLDFMSKDGRLKPTYDLINKDKFCLTSR